MGEKYDDIPTFDYKGMIIIGDLALQLQIEQDKEKVPDSCQNEELVTDSDN